MTQDELKKAVGWAALQYVQPGTIVGVGTGSTAAHFIDALGTMKGQIEGAVSSSDASTEKLKSLGITVFDLNEVDRLGIYVDGADEINGHMQMIKGGGAALTREKIIASVADKFICIADASKQVDILGNFPLPVEVIPMARSAVARQLVKLGGRPEYRQGVVTDNGNVILDVHGLEILDAIALENAINGIPGVVTVGLFANRGADEINGHMQMIKGGGAALTREKIIASEAKKFICIADASKEVDILGNFPLPVEVIPMARSAVARQLVKLGGRPEYRQGVVTDNGNVILDVHGLEILDAVAMENAINAIPGVVTGGLFANRGADVALIGTPDGVKTIVK